MTAQTRSTLYSYFMQGDKPTAAQFANLIDSSLNLIDPSAQSITSTINPTAGIVGVSTNSNAASGQIGEYISATVLAGSAVSLSNATVANVASISLTAGDWDVSGNVINLPAGGTTQTALSVGISTTSATFPSAPYAGGATNWLGSIVGGTGSILNTGVTRISIASTTTVYLIVYSVFSGSTNSAYGFIGARRAR